MASAPVSTSAPTVRLKNIFFFTDLGEASRVAFPYALALASRYNSQMSLIHSLGPVPYTPLPFDTIGPADDRSFKMVLPEMEKLRKECVAHGVQTSVDLKELDLLTLLNSEESHNHADLVVLGTYSHGAVYRMIAGSHAEKLVRSAPCPALAVGKHATGSARWRDRIARILIATDFEPGSRHAIDFIAPLAVEHKSEVKVLHVVEPIGVPLDVTELEAHEANRKLEEFVATLPLKNAIPALAVGMVHQEIVNYANRYDADLIVLGRRRAGFFVDHKPSTIVMAVTAEARCPVLTSF